MNYFRLTVAVLVVVVLYVVWPVNNDDGETRERRVVLEKRDIGTSIAYPGTGTVLHCGSTYSFPFIAPSGAGSSDSFSVVLFINAQPHSTIASGLKWEQRSFSWSVPASLPSRSDYFIRVTNGDALKSSLSLDSPKFTIVAVAVTLPATVSAGDVVAVKYAPPEQMPSYEIELWNDGKRLAPATQLPAGSSNTDVFWPVPIVLSAASSYNLMLYGLKSGARALLGASANFSVTAMPGSGQLKVRSPDRFQRWAKGSSQTVSFDPPTDITLQNWNIDIYSLVPGSPLEYGITIAKNLPLMPSSKTLSMETFWVPGKYFVRVWGWSTTQGPPGRPVFGVSETFTLTEVAGVSLTGERAFSISVPFTSQVIDASVPFTIEWSTITKKNIDTISIELYDDDSNTNSIQQAFVTTIVSRLPASAKSYTWNIPSYIRQSSFYYIRVWAFFSGSSKSAAVGFSEYFTINNNAPDASASSNDTLVRKSTNPNNSNRKGPNVSYQAEDFSIGAQMQIPFWTKTSGRLFVLFNFVLICFVV